MFVYLLDKPQEQDDSILLDHIVVSPTDMNGTLLGVLVGEGVYGRDSEAIDFIEKYLAYPHDTSISLVELNKYIENELAK